MIELCDRRLFYSQPRFPHTHAQRGKLGAPQVLGGSRAFSVGDDAGR